MEKFIKIYFTAEKDKCNYNPNLDKLNKIQIWCYSRSGILVFQNCTLRIRIALAKLSADAFISQCWLFYSANITPCIQKLHIFLAFTTIFIYTHKGNFGWILFNGRQYNPVSRINFNNSCDDETAESVRIVLKWLNEFYLKTGKVIPSWMLFYA